MPFGGGYQHRPGGLHSALAGWIVQPAQSDAFAPAAPSFPAVAAGPTRAGNLAYQVIVSAQATTPIVTPAPGGIKIPARGLFGGGYQFHPANQDFGQWPGWTVSPQIADAVHALPATGVPVFPSRIDPARRAQATAYDVVLHAQPVIIVTGAATGFPVFPDRAPGSRRATVDSYQVIVSPVPVPALDLGRFRLGDFVPLVYQAQVGITTAPVAVITGPLGVVDQPVMGTRGSYVFTTNELLNEAFPLGNYTVNIAGDLYTFTLVAGGDPAGTIVAMTYTKNVQGHRVLTQTARGELLLGTNPKIS